MMLRDLTTLHLGGPARRIVDAWNEQTLVEAVRAADLAREPVLILGGGSNLVVADEGFAGTVVRVLTRGVQQHHEGKDVVLQVQAGEPWDELVDRTVAGDLAGFECLSGIPGSVGATPIQNVGAYGQDVAQTVTAVRVYDRVNARTTELAGADCGFAYRWSLFKQEPGRWVVLDVAFALASSDLSAPVVYPELARFLGVETGARAPLHRVREAVLGLRRRKGMVIDSMDPDTASAGSFFLNPVLNHDQFKTLGDRARVYLGPSAVVPAYPAGDAQIKTSAAWLIERAGFGRGYGRLGGIAISSKHTLALTNQGGGTARELIGLAHVIAHSVYQVFGVVLHPEPVFVGVTWPDVRHALDGAEGTPLYRQVLR